MLNELCNLAYQNLGQLVTLFRQALCALVMTCAFFGQICTQSDESVDDF